MANSKITLTFNQDLVLDNTINFTISSSTPFYLDYAGYIWKNVRASSGQVTIGTPTAIDGERSAINFVQAFNLDCNPSGTNYNVSRVENVVEIESLITEIEFSNFSSIDDYLEFPPSYNSFVVADIVNSSTPQYVIDDINFSEADTLPCENVKVEIETSELTTVISSPVSTSNSDNPFSFDLLRGQNYVFTLKNADDLEINQLIQVPSLLSPDDFQIQVNSAPNGATAIVNSVSQSAGFDLLVFQYSLDDIDYYNSNVFSGLVEGDYTVYIKDQLGCSTTKTFHVDEFGILTPYFYISKANSIRFANRIDFGDAANYKNDENTLSCESNVILPFRDVQLFQSADVVRTQFKSNYTTNTAKVIKSDLTEVSVPVTKLTNNIGNKDLRDARKYDLLNGKTGIYFTTGNIYDFDSTLITGETHYLNGSIPYWVRIGGYIKTDMEWYLIEDIIYDDTKNAEVIVISSNYIGLDVSVVAGFIYNIFDYEVYEFEIDMVDYLGQEIKVQITATDDNFTTLNYLSEDIYVKVRHENTLAINYWNDDNTDVFYATGIKHLIRIPFYKIGAIDEDEFENNKTDTTTDLLSSEIYEVEEFTFEPVTKEIFRKIKIALSCKNVIIDGVDFVKNASFEAEGPLEDTNLYVLKARMIKTGSTFSSQSDSNIEFNFGSEEVVGLMEIGTDAFVKYN